MLVAISLSDLADAERGRAPRPCPSHSPARARAAGRAWRALPVYVLFTKADLIAGFVEFFDNMGREEREQVWGVTFPLDDGPRRGGSGRGVSAPDSTLLLGRLNERMLERVQQEPDLARRRLIYGFPAAACLVARRRLPSSSPSASVPAGWRPAPCCAASISPAAPRTARRSTACLARWPAEFGLPRQAVAAFSGSGRSLLPVAPGPRGRVRRGSAGRSGRKVERRAALDPACGTTPVAALCWLLLGGSWLASYIGNRDLIAEVHAGSGHIQYTDRRTATSVGRWIPTWPAVVPALDTLRDIRGGYDQRDAYAPDQLSHSAFTRATSLAALPATPMSAR